MTTVDAEVLSKLTKELREASTLMDREQARLLVDLYYRWQEHRIALGNQSRSLAEASKPTDVLDHFFSQVQTLEKQMINVLDKWTMSTEAGRWARGQVGVGPILAAGIISYIDMDKATTVSHIWRFAGLDPTFHWLGSEKARSLVADVMGTEKNPTQDHLIELAAKSNRKVEALERLATRDGNLTREGLERALSLRPWNADLKVICWRLGDSFVKVSGRENAYYGKLYRERKAYEIRKNEAKEFADQARETLATKRIQATETRRWYEQDMLPPGRIDLRARRYAVKLFLSHLWEVAYKEHYGQDPPQPYPIAYLGHADYLAPPPADTPQSEEDGTNE